LRQLDVLAPLQSIAANAGIDVATRSRQRVSVGKE